MKYKSIDRDILVVIVLTIIVLVLAFVLPPDWVPGRILTLPLVLVLPGYALTSALFSMPVPEVPKRLVLSLGLSLVIVVLGGLMLNLTPWGLSTGSWAVYLSGITLGSSAIALVLRRRQSIPASGWLRVGNIGLNFRQRLLLGLAALIVCGAVVVSIIGAEQQPYPGFTQLWVLPSSGANPKNAVLLGVSNMELTTMEYRLAVNVDGKVVKEWPSINLNSHEKWEATLLLPQTGSVGTAKVEADLYRVNAPTTIYRYVVLWLGS